MLDYKKERLNYGEQLAPPAGFTLSKAIATTYSLELETLTAATIALGLNEATDSQLLDSKISAFKAIETVSQKLVIFCEAGQISMPTTPSPLHMLFEKCIVPVALPGKPHSNIYPSFHPKCWLLEYEKPGNGKTEMFYRFIVMSRNLTSDRSWDISVVLEGKEVDRRLTKNRHLKNFLEFLGTHIKTSDPDKRKKQKIINEMIDKLDFVYFSASAGDKPFYDYSIMPLGISENNDSIWSDDELFKDTTCHDIAVMSPFLTHDIIEILNNKLCQLTEKNRGILVTRRSELARIKDVVSNFDVYVMKDAIIDGEDNLPEDTDVSPHQRQDIHAKMFLYRKNSDSYLYVGSMNASERGTGIYPYEDTEGKSINVELMVKLWTKNMYLNRNKFFQDVIGEDEVSSPFQKVSFDSEDFKEPSADPTNMLLQKIKKICRGNLSASVIGNGGAYSLSINSPISFSTEGLSIFPLYTPGLKQQFSNQMVFENLSVNQLSELYCISCTNGEDQVEKIIFIPTKGIPEERDKSIIKFAISNKKEFSEYVAFMLGDSYMQTLSEIMDNANKFGDCKYHRSSIMTAVYEQMIKVACSDPTRLKEIKRIVDTINDENIVPIEFSNMYQTFMEALKLCPRKSKKN